MICNDEHTSGCLTSAEMGQFETWSRSLLPSVYQFAVSISPGSGPDKSGCEKLSPFGRITRHPEKACRTHLPRPLCG